MTSLFFTHVIVLYCPMVVAIFLKCFVWIALGYATISLVSVC